LHAAAFFLTPNALENKLMRSFKELNNCKITFFVSFSLDDEKCAISKGFSLCTYKHGENYDLWHVQTL
jgi:hypothetical protein